MLDVNDEEQKEEQPQQPPSTPAQEENESWQATTTIRVFTVTNETNKPYTLHLRLFYPD
jgi:hypothetical protein